MAGVIIVYVLLPFLSPILFRIGLDRPAWWIQTLYRYLCHQRPERSVFLFGEKLTYSIADLHNYGYDISYVGYPFIGDATIGYKVAFCVRDIFIYTIMAAAAIFVSASKMRVHVKWFILILLTVPMIIDGTTQFIAEFLFLTQTSWGIHLAKPFYLSNNFRRAITGSMFGIGSGLFLFSELKAAVTDDRRD